VCACVRACVHARICARLRVCVRDDARSADKKTTWITVEKGNGSLKDARRSLAQKGDFDDALKKLKEAEEHFGAAWRWALPLHAEEDLEESAATWMGKKIANAQDRCKKLWHIIDTDKSTLQTIRAELHTLSKHEAGSKKMRLKLTKEKTELERQIQSNRDALSKDKDPEKCGAEGYVEILMDLEASSEKLKALAHEIDASKQFLSLGKTHIENAAKKVERLQRLPLIMS